MNDGLPIFIGSPPDSDDSDERSHPLPTRFKIGDWVTLDRDNYEVQAAIESERSETFDYSHLSNFFSGLTLECRDDEESGDVWCRVLHFDDGHELWLPASWLYKKSHEEVMDDSIVRIVADVSYLLPPVSEISVEGHPCRLKIFPDQARQN